MNDCEGIPYWVLIRNQVNISASEPSAIYNFISLQTRLIDHKAEARSLANRSRGSAVQDLSNETWMLNHR